jgi:hypothetical protein
VDDNTRWFDTLVLSYPPATVAGTADYGDDMAVKIDLTLDCLNPTAQARFWKLALGYIDEPPPPPFATREEWLAQFDLSDDDQDDGAWLCHPERTGPRLFLQHVREPKTQKIRLHLDVRVSTAENKAQRWAQVVAKVDRLVEAGATVIHEDTGHHMVLADPEGNEFCVA